MMKRRKWVSYMFIFFITCGGLTASRCNKSDPPPVIPIDPPQENTFTNPLMRGADPWVYQDGATYYYMQTVGNAVKIWKTDALSQLASAVSTEVFSPQAGQPNSRNIWAPEIHRIDNKWYIYYTAGNGDDATQRTWVLENSNEDPTKGAWVEKGRIYNQNADFWAIDGTVMQYKGENYFIWCGRPDPTNIIKTQNIYISKMSNPWTLVGPVTMLTQPELSWERIGFGVNEAPQVLKAPDNTMYLVYSASYCGEDDYALGMLTLKDNGDPLNIDDWTKSQQPVFTKSAQSNAYGPGHNAFFKSPDGKEHWIIYHANSSSGEGCGPARSIRMQEFTYNSTGMPVFGEPVATGMKIEKPAGEE